MNMEYVLDTEDLMMLFGIRKNRPYNKFQMIQIEAENAWLNGDDADKNPYKAGSASHSAWFNKWHECNIYG